ncbi:hypothetical protein DER46DRAFT_671938 [Fusarium sp. MPI-SDFR-AT-0072]|nr:hypothetical protein DER46DRAFT_671938 [Fusarium sp. MPI-SDFR-AT-0072]
MATAQVNNFIGMQYTREGNEYEKEDYNFFNQQYATSSYIDAPDHKLDPALILKPKDDNDVMSAINYAVDKKVGIAIKSGGHQYSGACSCSGDNVQLDVSNAYKDLKIISNPTIPVPDDRVLVFAGVGNQLQDFLAYLASHGLFAPTGQCAYVCLGGHGQTGGYGQLGRSFGLLGDYITEIRMIDHSGKVQIINKDQNAELFYAIRGGSPGNFGVITHYTIMVFKAKSYMGIENTIKTQSFDSSLTTSVPYWLKYDESTDAWFQQFRNLDNFKHGCVHFDEFPADMANMTGHWVFPQRREFPRPYVKRTYATNSKTLGKDGWVNALAGRLSKICDPYEKLDDANERPVPNPLYDNCKLSAQIQCFGGENSMFYKNGDGSSAYSWRDSTVLQTVDCWYLNITDPNYKISQNLANQWQKENDGVMIGAKSCFSKTDRRVLWGSWGSWDMASPDVWKTYYEDEAKYQRLGKARAAADPNGTFTANPFAVARQS